MSWERRRLSWALGSTAESLEQRAVGSPKVRPGISSSPPSDPNPTRGLGSPLCSLQLKHRKAPIYP